MMVLILMLPGARTLFLSVEDADNPIDTTTNGLPTLIYTVNGGNTQTATSELVSSVCNAKANTCTFAATTGDLQAGDDVSYYWEFQDAAYPTLLKPSQQPNVATSNVATFTIADPNTAPEDGTDMKITTLVTDVDAAYDGGGKSTSKTVTIDRQMTYYQSTNEYHFEYDTSRCGSYSGTDAAKACFSTNSNEDYGAWLVSWNNDDSSLCALAECGGAADNVLDLAKAQGGILDISRQHGSGDVVLLYDATSQGWAVTVVDATPEIDELLSADAPGAQTVSNDAPGVGFPWTAFISLPNQNWYGSSYVVDSAFVVNPGETMRISINLWLVVFRNGCYSQRRRLVVEPEHTHSAQVLTTLYGQIPMETVQTAVPCMLRKKHLKMQHLNQHTLTPNQDQNGCHMVSQLISLPLLTSLDNSVKSPSEQARRLT